MYRPVLATQPSSTTAYRVYRLVLATQPCTLASTTGLQSVPAGTGYTAFFNNYLQSVPTGTGYTALYTCFNNWLQSVPAGTGYTALCTCFNLPVTKYTNRVLATQSLLYSASSQLVTHTKKKKKKAGEIYTSRCQNALVTPACQFFAGYRELLVTVKYRIWSPGTGQSCLR